MGSRFKLGLLLVLLAAAQAWGWIEVSRAVNGRPSVLAVPARRDLSLRHLRAERADRSHAPEADYAEPESQAERMLKDPHARDPAFIPPAPQKPRLAWGAGCRTRDGAIRLSWSDPEGYARCLEERQTPGSGGRAAGAIIGN